VLITWLSFSWFSNFVAACMPKIKTARSITVDSLCDFSEADKMQKVTIIYFNFGLMILEF